MRRIGGALEVAPIANDDLVPRARSHPIRHPICCTGSASPAGRATLDHTVSQPLGSCRCLAKVEVAGSNPVIRSQMRRSRPLLAVT